MSYTAIDKTVRLMDETHDELDDTKRKDKIKSLIHGLMTQEEEMNESDSLSFLSVVEVFVDQNEEHQPPSDSYSYFVRKLFFHGSPSSQIFIQRQKEDLWIP